MSDFDNYGKTCANCGGDYAIHHYATSQCPVGGREAPEGRKQEWKTSTFQEMPQPQMMTHQAEYDKLTARITELEAQLAAAREIIAKYAGHDYGIDSLTAAGFVCRCGLNDELAQMEVKP